MLKIHKLVPWQWIQPLPRTGERVPAGRKRLPHPTIQLGIVEIALTLLAIVLALSAALLTGGWYATRARAV
jgi:hypothetical protein